MSDRELLEKAAKAAGLLVECHKGAMAILEQDGNDVWRTDVYWNPLTDDGEALRLAVKCGIDLVHFCGHVRCDVSGRSDVYEMHGDDAYAATRRAIVRAAAAMAPKSDPRDPSSGGGS